MGKLDAIYAKLPVPLQNGAVTLYGAYWHWLRFGGNYKEIEAGYRKREGYSEEQWKAYQSIQLIKLLSLAAATVPYYQDCWTKEQKEAAQRGVLEELPLLEKDPIRNNPRAFLSTKVSQKGIKTFYTSGSTGTPISTMWTPREIQDSVAVREVRSVNWAGVSYKLPRATFSGRMVEPNPLSQGPFYRYNAVERQVYFSPFHLRSSTAHQYIRALRDHGIQWMTGYAVSFYLLAQFILEQKIEAPPIKAVITTSEKLLPEMRKTIEDAFSCRVYEEYSTVENAVFASECERGNLHVSPDVGVVEILRPDGTSCEPGEPGEVVTTCIMRFLQPFIRYRLGDIAVWDTEKCSCGRQMPVIKEVVGRIEDVIIGPDGRKMVRFHGVFVNQPHIREGQIIQETLHQIKVNIVPTDGFADTDAQDVVHRIQQRLGASVNVAVNIVDKIPLSKSGKFKAVISLLEKTPN